MTKNSFDGTVSYFYEAGHASKTEANALMSRIFSNAALRGTYHYGSHTFADKQQLRPLQAADILAWQWGLK